MFVENSEIRPDSEILTSDIREPVGLNFNPKASGACECSPRWGFVTGEAPHENRGYFLWGYALKPKFRFEKKNLL